MSYNKTIIMGRLTADPESKTVGANDTTLTEIRLAFDNGWGDNKKTTFIQANVWGKQGEFVQNNFTKGDGILIEGRIDFDQWDDKETGKKRSKHYITVERATFTLSSKGAGGGVANAVAKAVGGTAVDPDSIPF